MTSELLKIVSYSCFIELMQGILSMTIFAKACCLGKCTGISFVNSTPIRVCKTSYEWYESICSIGYNVSFYITQANVDDRESLKNESFLRTVFGKRYGDKGYIEVVTRVSFC